MLKRIDDSLWRFLFGEADYMQLRPSAGKRLGMLARLPISIGRSVCPDPVFIVGCPRSGTTILFEILRRAADLSDMDQESHWIWEAFHRPLAGGRDSHLRDASDLTPASRLFIRTMYRAAFGRERFVDKCPTHSLRIFAIRALFPGAVFVWLHRNAPDTVSSLIDSWLDDEWFPGFRVPEELDIAGYGRQRWVHLLPPGWRRYVRAPIEEVCAHQWVAANEVLDRARRRTPRSHWVDIRYEALLEAPERTVETLFDGLGLEVSDRVRSFVRSLDDRVTNTRSRPGVGKWRRRNPERLERVLPKLRRAASKLDYGPAVEASWRSPPG